MKGRRRQDTPPPPKKRRKADYDDDDEEEEVEYEQDEEESYEEQAEWNSDIAAREYHQYDKGLKRLDSLYPQALKKLNWYTYLHKQPNTSRMLGYIADEERKAQDDVNYYADGIAKYEDGKKWCYQQYFIFKEKEDRERERYQQQQQACFHKQQYQQQDIEAWEEIEDDEKSEDLVKELDEEEDDHVVVSNKPAVVHIATWPRVFRSSSYVNEEDDGNGGGNADDETTEENDESSENDRLLDQEEEGGEDDEKNEGDDRYERQPDADNENRTQVVTKGITRKHSSPHQQRSQKFSNSNAYTSQDSLFYSPSTASSTVYYSTNHPPTNSSSPHKYSNHITTMDAHAQSAQYTTSSQRKYNYANSSRRERERNYADSESSAVAEGPLENDENHYEELNEETLLTPDITDVTLAAEDARSDEVEPDEDIDFLDKELQKDLECSSSGSHIDESEWNTGQAYYEYGDATDMDMSHHTSTTPSNELVPSPPHEHQLEPEKLVIMALPPDTSIQPSAAI